MGCTPSVSAINTVPVFDVDQRKFPARSSFEPVDSVNDVPQSSKAPHISVDVVERTLNPSINELFEFSDFCVGVGADGKGQGTQTPKRKKSTWRKKSSVGDMFVFGDFRVGLETKLEDDIVENYVQGNYHSGSLRSVSLLNELINICSSHR